MSLYHFFGEQGPEHGERLFWSDTLGGLPYRGQSAPMLTRDELDTMVEIHQDFHCEEFDLNDPEAKSRYIGVMTRVVNGWYVLHYRSEPSPSKRILEWSQRYGELAPGAKPASGGR